MTRVCAMLEEENYCGLLCQHPSCWSAQRRQGRGVKLPNYSSSISDDEDGGLPSQKVVNLLDNYGEDASDRYPSNVGGRPTHVRSSTLSTVHRGHSGASVPRTRAPNATPASTLTTNDKLSSSSVEQLSRIQTHNLHLPIKPQSKVGRVEVQEVFDPADLASDWNETFMAKKFYVWVPKKTKKNADVQPFTGVQSKVEMKDVTEALVPMEIEWQREASRVFDEVGPVIKHRPLKSPDESLLRRTPHTATRRGNYHGIYELLDLPRDVLIQVLDHVHERDLLDRHRFAHAIMAAIPKMEKGSSSLALAGSGVLRQSKMQLLDSHLRTSRESFPSNGQMVKLDRDAWEKLSVANQHVMKQSGTAAAAANQPASPAHTHTLQALNRKKPLPAIQGSQEGHEKQTNKPAKTLVPRISLGLPQIPSGPSGLPPKPFNYNNTQLDFTLGPVSLRRPSEEVHRDPESSPSDDHSTIHITMPSLTSNQPINGINQSQLRTPLTSYLFSNPSWDQAEPPLHAISPSYSTNVPKTPSATPATRAGMYYHGNDITAPFSPVKFRGRSDLSTPGALPQATPDNAHGLRTIPESEQDQEALRSIHGHGQAATHSIRSLRHQGDGPPPPQPPSSPDLSNKSTSPQHRVGGVSATYMNSPGELTQRTLQKTEAEHRQTPPTPGCTPEPWPQVDEDEFKNPPTPQPHDPYTTPVTNPPTSVMETHLEMQAELGEQSVQSQTGLAGGRAIESPAPPPPSPDASQLLPNTGSTHHHITVPVITEDTLDSCSDLTITARPPSNLEDFSRINTPADTSRVPSHSNTPADTSRVPSHSNTPRLAVDNLHPQVDTDVAVDGGESSQQQPASAEAPLAQSNTAGQHLDQFGATEESLAQELKEEYNRLSD